MARLREEAADLRSRLENALKRQPRKDSIDSAFIRKVDWRIDNISAKIRSCPRNSCIMSEKFSIMGAQDLVLEFFPQGRDSTMMEGFCALFLWCPPGVRIKYQLRVGDHRATLDEDTYESRMGHGHSNLCRLEGQINKATDSVVVGLDVFEMTVYSEPEPPLKQDDKVLAPVLRLVNDGPEAAVAREASIIQKRSVDCCEWRIKDIRRRVAEVPQGCAVCSPLFSIAGIRDIQLEFYPNGLDTPSQSKPGYCGFFVRFPTGNYQLVLTIFVGNAKKGPIKTEIRGESANAKGEPSFCLVSDQLVDGEDDLVVGVSIQNPLLAEEETERTLYL
eukprot:TRINITY_DN33183_c0_g1_i2.p1 TRINITY_DN33183_c0_g1~~TRINITY_DN33183_c0_g1_i2.p1  ORF type:complete len:363 (-),score=55.03 TRINITY_DN33183_c0_g1_i2:100-1095(-)